MASLLGSSKELDAAYHDIPETGFVAELGKARLPQNEIAFNTNMAAGIRTGEFADETTRTESITGA